MKVKLFFFKKRVNFLSKSTLTTIFIRNISKDSVDIVWHCAGREITNLKKKLDMTL